jgi:hypothetical protein
MPTVDSLKVRGNNSGERGGQNLEKTQKKGFTT